MDSAQPLQVGTHLEGFEITRINNTDPSRFIYTATELASKKLVAIHEYPIVAKEGLAALAKARHPNLPPMVRAFEADGRAYLVTEPVAGEALSEILKRESTFDEARLKSVLLPLADGLEAAHAAGALHLDIRPEHILVKGNGSPMLVGFGAGAQTCTPGYSAIEQYSPEYRTGRWTDVYALGALAYRLISGIDPLEARIRSTRDIMRPARDIGTDKYHRSLLQSIDWALKVHPLERPQNLAQWKDALLGLRDTVVVGAGAGATVPITATMIRKFSELRDKKRTQPAKPTTQPVIPESAPQRGGANATPIPPSEPAAPPPPMKPVPVVVPPKPVPVAVPPKPMPAVVPPKPVSRPIPPTVTPPKPAAPPLVAPARRVPKMTSPPAEPSSMLSGIGAVVVLLLAVGYWWYTDARRSSPPAPVAATAAPTQTQPAAVAQPAVPPPSPEPVVRAEQPPPIEPAAPVVETPPPAPEQTAAEQAPRRTRDPEAPAGAAAQKQLVADLRQKLSGTWTQESTYVATTPGSDCYARIARSWSIRIIGTADDGRALTGAFTTGVRAQSVERSDCRQFDDQIRVEGTLDARPLSATTLQVEAVPTRCSGDCDPIAEVFNYRTLERRYRFAISREADRMSFSEGEVDFEVSKPR